MARVRVERLHGATARFGTQTRALLAPQAHCFYRVAFGSVRMESNSLELTLVGYRTAAVPVGQSRVSTEQGAVSHGCTGW